MCKKTKIKWASVVTSLGVIVSAIVVPMVQEFRTDEKLINNDETIISILTKKVHGMEDKIKQMESAVNLALRHGR